IVAAPVVRFDRVLETVGDLDRLGATRKIGDQKAELVAAESRVKIARVGAAAFKGEKVFRTNLIRKNARNAFDDPIADGVTERVVVPLEAVDVDDADAAPADALFDRKK